MVIVGRGLTIGRPLANLLALKRPDANAAVTVVHTGVPDIGEYTRRADIVVAAAGSPGIITGDMIRPGAAVVAAGVSFSDGKLLSDVADDVAEVAGWLSPKVGGVGPMTRAPCCSPTPSPPRSAPPKPRARPARWPRQRNGAGLMERIAELLAAGPTLSVEFFPPKTDAGLENLEHTIDDLVAIGEADERPTSCPSSPSPTAPVAAPATAPGIWSSR